VPVIRLHRVEIEWTPEIEVWEICTFEMIWQEVAYLTEYLNNYWTDLHQCFSFGRGMYGDYETDISFTLFQRTLQLILGDFCFTLVFWNKMYHCLVDVCINSSTNCSISCKKMVKIGSVVFELKWCRKWKLCCDSGKIWQFSFIWHTGVLAWTGILQFWF